MTTHPTDGDAVLVAADRAIAGIEGIADAWAAETDLVCNIKNIVSPMLLNRNAPDDVRKNFTARMEQLVDALVRQSFMEGFMRGGFSRQDHDKPRIEALSTEVERLTREQAIAAESRLSSIEAETRADERRKCMSLICSGCAAEIEVNEFGYHDHGSGLTRPCHAAAIRSSKEG